MKQNLTRKLVDILIPVRELQEIILEAYHFEFEIGAYLYNSNRIPLFLRLTFIVYTSINLSFLKIINSPTVYRVKLI